MGQALEIVVLGLSITSSWGNGHATTYRALIRGLRRRGHRVTFLERDTPWYADNRDLPHPPDCRTHLYAGLTELDRRFAPLVHAADLVIVGSYVPQGVEVGRWVIEHAGGLRAFYDIDTPVTLAKLGRGDQEYLTPELVRRYDMYLSFTGGPTLEVIERELGSPMARALYCSVDPDRYYPQPAAPTWDLGYMGTYSEDRQGPLGELLVEPACAWGEGRFVVAGPQYPEAIAWPGNVERISHLPPVEHRWFYNRQRFTLNITRADMVRAGHSPSVRLFEAAACGVPIISDVWSGIEAIFTPGEEILLARSPRDTLRYLRELTAGEARRIGLRARAAVLRHHTADRRAAELEAYIHAAAERPRRLATLAVPPTTTNRTITA